jgi:arginyl-tRNA synthetase
MSTLSPARYVPYAFARTHQVLVAAASGDELNLVAPAPVQALAELSRTLPTGW